MKGSVEVQLPTTGDRGPLRWVTHEEDVTLSTAGLPVRRVGVFVCSTVLLTFKFGLPRVGVGEVPYWLLRFTLPDGMQMIARIEPDLTDQAAGTRDRQGWLWITDWVIYGMEKAASSAVFCALWEVLNVPSTSIADEHSIRKEPT